MFCCSQDSLHRAKQQKMLNCAAVSFELETGRVNGKVWHRVVEETITVIHGGFKTKKKKGSKAK